MQNKQRLRFSADTSQDTSRSGKDAGLILWDGQSNWAAEFSKTKTVDSKRSLLDEKLLLLWIQGPDPAASEKPPFRDDDAASVHTQYEDYDPARHHPAFYGKMHQKIEGIDTDLYSDFDPAVSHPALAGYTLLDKPPKAPSPGPPELPDPKKCAPRTYLETYVFPVLLPALEEMLKQAKIEKCFERKRTKFNGLDFLTEYLYNKNQKYTDREDVPLAEIPFVQEHWKDHPRPPLPMSLLWTEEEAALILQSFWRGYKVRCETEIQELRQWQRDWREENANIKNKVDAFWSEQMPEGEEVDKPDCAAVEGSDQAVTSSESGDPEATSPEAQTDCESTPAQVDQDPAPDSQQPEQLATESEPANAAEQEEAEVSPQDQLLAGTHLDA